VIPTVADKKERLYEIEHSIMESKASYVESKDGFLLKAKKEIKCYL
jgi:hypothetical protein